MDPVSAINFAATILTVVDFSWNLISGSYKIYQSTTGATTDHAQISTVLDDLQTITRSLRSDVKENNAHVKDLRKLAVECAEVSQELSNILEELKRKEGNKIWRSLEAKWKCMRKEKELTSIEQRLNTYRLQLLLRLNVMLSEQQSSVESQLDEIQQTGLHVAGEGLDKLEVIHESVRELEKKLVAELFESLKVSDADKVNSLAGIRASLSTLLFQLEAVPKATTENRILRRLYFNSIYSRENIIGDAEGGTYSWLLEDERRNDNEIIESQPNSVPDLGGSESSTTVEHQNNGALADTIHSKNSTGLQNDIRPDGETKNHATSQRGNKDAMFSEDERENSENPKIKEVIPSNNSIDLEMQRRTRQSFLKWLNSGNQIYHVSGKAGSGKSTLMKFLCQHPHVIEELREWTKDKKLAFAKFFFWNSGDREQKSLEGLYRSLLFEILKQCPEIIKEAFPRFWAKSEMEIAGLEGVPFLFSELKDAMNVIVGKHNFPNHRFCFFIDGLDEFEGDSTDHWELARSLKRWAVSADVKICVSSRPHTEFLEAFDSNLRMHLHELTRGDIRRFICATFEKEPNFDKMDKSFSEIVSDIVNSADGVFLWVRLVVRSLLDGIRHRYSLSALKEKLEKIPRGLDSLFDKLLNSIDPSDRERSDKMLILAACHGSLNALMFSWLEDLDDPDFPFSAQIQGYSDEEIRKRQEIVRCQIDSLSKGLLEMSCNEIDENMDKFMKSEFPMATQDIYFQQKVQFFHRTARDYLNEPIKLAEIKCRLGDFDTAEAYKRLLLAEFKFARTMNDYFKTQGIGQTAFVSSFRAMFHPFENGLPLKFLEEYGRVLDYHRQNPFSYPDETQDNLGVIAWGQDFDPIEGCGMLFGKGFSYLHWTAYEGHRKYVISQVLADPKLVIPHNGRSLLLSASIRGHYDLVCDLLKQGASPNHQIEVACRKDFSRSHPTSVWAVFLFFIITRVSIVREETGVNCSCWFLILEEFLKKGASNDVYFLLKEGKHFNQHRGFIVSIIVRQSVAYGYHGFVTSEEDLNRNEDDLLFFTLEDFILMEQPSNMDALLRWTLKGKGSWLWNETMQVISALTPWIGGPNDFESKYKRARINDLDNWKRNYVLQSVHIKGDRLDEGFLVGLF